MVKSRVAVPVIYLLITIFYFGFILVQIINAHLPDLIPIKIGNTNLSAIDDLVLIFTIPTLMMCVFALFAKSSAILNFKLMKKFQRNYEYYYVNMGDRIISGQKVINRALLPVILSLALSLLVNSNPLFYRIFGIDTPITIIMFSLMFSPLTCLLLMPVWVFMDSGVVKLKTKTSKRVPPEMSYFGKAQIALYRGFAGITTPIMYVLTISSELSLNKPFSLVILLYPVFLFGIFMPFFLIFNSRIDKVSKKLIEKLHLEPLKIENIEKNI